MKATVRKFIGCVVIAAYSVVVLAQDPHAKGSPPATPPRR